MKREILINANPRETRVAIIEDDQLVELLVDRPDARRMVGDIYLGRVEAVLPGIQAAFVDIGTEKSAFSTRRISFSPKTSLTTTTMMTTMKTMQPTTSPKRAVPLAALEVAVVAAAADAVARKRPRFKMF